MNDKKLKIKLNNIADLINEAGLSAAKAEVSMQKILSSLSIASQVAKNFTAKKKNLEIKDKIDNMNEREKKLWLNAIDVLIEYYSDWGVDNIPENFSIRKPPCPLCIVNNLLNKRNLSRGCQECPWELFEEQGCLTPDKFGKTYKDYPIKDRLKRLRRWKKEIRRLK